MDIVNGMELEPNEIGIVVDLEYAPKNKSDVVVRQVEIKDWRKGSKKAASFITQTIDDVIVMSLDVYEMNLVLILIQPAEDCNTVTPAQRSSTRKEFLYFVISYEGPL